LSISHCVSSLHCIGRQVLALGNRRRRLLPARPLAGDAGAGLPPRRLVAGSGAAGAGALLDDGDLRAAAREHAAQGASLPPAGGAPLLRPGGAGTRRVAGKKRISEEPRKPGRKKAFAFFLGSWVPQKSSAAPPWRRDRIGRRRRAGLLGGAVPG